MFATCKESILNFYKSQGYKTCLVKNTVRIPADIKENFKNTNYYNINEFKNLKIGLYAAGNDWRKNISDPHLDLQIQMNKEGGFNMIFF